MAHLSILLGALCRLHIPVECGRRAFEFRAKPQSTWTATPMTTNCYVVGIGASAGGLEAITELLSGLEDTPGLALLVVQHLDPTHGSMLSQILADKVDMPVHEAVDGQLIEPNHVYVIAPNTSMIVEKRHLRIRERNKRATSPLPVDKLFNSMAHDLGTDAIGVLLSGSGSDGSLGLRAIRDKGGVTFAQDEASARFISMPGAAVTLGGVDYVLAPHAIAHELMRLGARSKLSDRRLMTDSDQINSSEAEEIIWQKIFRLLMDACQIDFSLYKHGTVQRRLERRRLQLQCATLTEYLALLESSAEEVKRLCQDILIHVTRFFRDPASYEELAQIVWPRLLKGRAPDRTIRIWVAGCSSGEEAYSLAISLLEVLKEQGSAAAIQVFGTDVSETAIATARAGTYSNDVVRDVSPERLERFFVKRGERYQVIRSLREQCIFSRHDVTREPPFSRIDLVSCRNLLIYLGTEAQRRLLPLLHYALTDGGFLTLGSAESIGSFSELFNPLDQSRANVYVKKLSVSRVLFESGKAGALAHNLEGDLVTKERRAWQDSSEPGQLQREAERLAQARYVPAAVLCDKLLNIIQFRGNTGQYLVNPSGPPSSSLKKLAPPELLVEIELAVQQARQEGCPTRRPGIRINGPDGISALTLEVVVVKPADGSQEGVLIFFEPESLPLSITATSVGLRWTSMLDKLRMFLSPPLRTDTKISQVEGLESILASTREYVRTLLERHEGLVEELRLTQQELISSNEDRNGSIEQLETAKEEMQSANEELLTTNDELQHRNAELHGLTRRLQDADSYSSAIVDTVRQPLLVLDQSLHVVRVNRSFARMFKVTPEETQNQLIYELGDRQWDIPVLRRLLEGILPTEVSLEDYEVTHDFPRIGERTLRLNALRLDLPGYALILLAMEDVTDR